MVRRRSGSPTSSGIGSLASVPLPSLVPRDKVFFDLFNQSGQNSLRAARMLQEMLGNWPDEASMAREILLAEQEGDRITHDIIQRVNTTFVTPLDGEDIYALATQLDDIVDFIEEAADFLVLYKIEAPMDQALAMADVLVKSCEQLSAVLAGLRNFKDLEQYWIEIHRLENDGDRIYRDAVASLFANGIDPMVVIRWKDIFTVLERAIDACETAAHIIEGIVIKNA
jgi:predicted phosphate transport protein (TIGR00153 family)